MFHNFPISSPIDVEGSIIEAIKSTTIDTIVVHEDGSHPGSREGINAIKKLPKHSGHKPKQQNNGEVFV